MQATAISLDRYFELRRSPSGNAILCLSLSECDPCRKFTAFLETFCAPAGVCLYVCKIEREDRKAMGRVLLNGVKLFPQIEICRPRGSALVIQGLPTSDTGELTQTYFMELLTGALGASA